MKITRSILAGILASLLLASCVAPPKETDANGKKIEYVYYTPTGSSIPVRVPKDSLKLSDSEADAQQKGFTDLQRDAQPGNPPAVGGK
jgi:hypothetical protein